MSGDDQPGDRDVVLLIDAVGAVVVVTAALTRYVVELATGAARSAWAAGSAHRGVPGHSPNSRVGRGNPDNAAAR
jgi:hypothetical protein